MFKFVCFLLGNSKVSVVYTLFHLHIQVGMKCTYLPKKTEQTECSKTLAFKLHTPVNHPEESIQTLEHGKGLKSRMFKLHYSLQLH
jgi:hypothetical protein